MKLFNIAFFVVMCSTAVSSFGVEEYQEPMVDLWCDSQQIVLRIPSSEFQTNLEKFAQYCDKAWFAEHRTDNTPNEE